MTDFLLIGVILMLLFIAAAIRDQTRAIRTELEALRTQLGRLDRERVERERRVRAGVQS